MYGFVCQAMNIKRIEVIFYYLIHFIFLNLIISIGLDCSWWDYINSPKIWQETNIAGLLVITCYVNVDSWKFDNCFCSITRVWCLQWGYFIYHVPISCLTNRIEFIVTKLLFVKEVKFLNSANIPGMLLDRVRWLAASLYKISITFSHSRIRCWKFTVFIFLYICYVRRQKINIKGSNEAVKIKNIYYDYIFAKT